MPLKALVKVGSLTNLSDARYCAGMGVGMMGFNVIPGHPAYVEATKFHEIRGWITGPSIVAELHGLTSMAQLDQVIENYKPDYFEFGIQELAILQDTTLPYILVIGENDSMPVFDRRPTFLLLKRLVKLSDATNIDMLVEVDTPEGTMVALDQPNVVGIAMKGSSEIRPGFKTYDAMADILEILDVD